MLEKSSIFAWLALFSLACGETAPSPDVASGDSGETVVGGSLAMAGAGNGTGPRGAAGTVSGNATAGSSGETNPGNIGLDPSVGAAGTGSGGTGSGEVAAMEWLPSWATTIQSTETANLPPPLPNNTLRQFVWPTVSGEQIRIQLSNERGASPVDIQKVHIAKALTAADPGNSGGQIDAATDAAFTFGGVANVTIPAGETVWSDPLSFPLQEIQLTSITMQLGDAVPAAVTGHPGSRTTSYVASGDAVSQQGLAGAQTRDRWYFIDAIEVMAPADAYAIAVLGDSITDGYGVLNQFGRWTDALTLAIQNDPMIADTRSVLNFGMGANNLTTSGEFQDSGLVRFERDVLARDKIKWLFVMEGTNDIIYSNVQAPALISAYSQIIQKAHEKGILVYGSPITPTNQGSADIRNEVNAWIRDSGQFDAVVDFEKVIGDPNAANTILAMFNNDGLHPNLAGYAAMGNAVPLPLFYTPMGQ
jgi:lysophospholipase L1-like esterase